MEDSGLPLSCTDDYDVWVSKAPPREEEEVINIIYSQ